MGRGYRGPILSTGEDDDTIETLRERLRRLETAVEASGLGLWEWDVRTGRLAWNARNRELMGVDPERPLTIEDYAQLVHPDDREDLRATYLEARERAEDGAFASEHRTLATPDGKVRWVQLRGRVIRDADGVRMAVGSTIDVTDRKNAEARRNLILRELAHRAKNGIVVLMTIVAQTAKRATGVKEFEQVLLSRLQALADCQDLVTQAGGRSLPLADLLERAFTPFDASRFDLDARLKAVSISNEMVVGMALLLHELSTNAVKYGSLSAPTGRVRLGFSEDAEGKGRIAWVETGGPEVRPATRKGFGTRLLDISLRNDGGHVVARFDPAGFQADIHFPMGRD